MSAEAQWRNPERMGDQLTVLLKSLPYRSIIEEDHSITDIIIVHLSTLTFNIFLHGLVIVERIPLKIENNGLRIHSLPGIMESAEADNSCRIPFVWDLKVFPLSETIFHGNPLLAVKRLKLRMNASTVISGTTSKCTALRNYAASIQTYPYLLFLQDISRLHIQWPCKVHSSVCKWWLCIDSKFWQW